MPTPAKTQKCCGRSPNVIVVEWNYLCANLPQQDLEDGTRVLPHARRENHCGLHHARRANQHFPGLVDLNREPLMAWLFQH